MIQFSLLTIQYFIEKSWMEGNKEIFQQHLSSFSYFQRVCVIIRNAVGRISLLSSSSIIIVRGVVTFESEFADCQLNGYIDSLFLSFCFIYLCMYVCMYNLFSKYAIRVMLQSQCFSQEDSTSAADRKCKCFAYYFLIYIIPYIFHSNYYQSKDIVRKMINICFPAEITSERFEFKL